MHLLESCSRGGTNGDRMDKKNIFFFEEHQYDKMFINEKIDGSNMIYSKTIIPKYYHSDLIKNNYKNGDEEIIYRNIPRPTDFSKQLKMF